MRNDFACCWRWRGLFATLAIIVADRGEKDVAHKEDTLQLEIARHGQLIASRRQSGSNSASLDLASIAPKIVEASQEALVEQAASSILETQPRLDASNANRANLVEYGGHGSGGGTGSATPEDTEEDVVVHSSQQVKAGSGQVQKQKSPTVAANTNEDAAESVDESVVKTKVVSKSGTAKQAEARSVHSTPVAVQRETVEDTTEARSVQSNPATVERETTEDTSEDLPTDDLMCCSCWSAVYKDPEGERWYPKKMAASKSLKPYHCRAGQGASVCADGESSILAWSPEWTEGVKPLPKCQSMWQKCHDTTVQGGGWFQQVLDRDDEERYHSNPFWVEGWYWPSLFEGCLKEKEGAKAVGAYCNQEDFQKEKRTQVHSYLKSSRTCTTPSAQTDGSGSEREETIPNSREEANANANANGNGKKQKRSTEDSNTKDEGNERDTGLGSGGTNEDDSDEDEESNTTKSTRKYNWHSRYGSSPRCHTPAVVLGLVLPVLMMVLAMF